MNWTTKKIWFIHYLIIIVFTFIISFFIESYIELSENTLLWMTSTIVQAFGALIAVTIAIGLFEKERIERNIERLLSNVLGNEVFKYDPKLIKNQLPHPELGYYIKLKEREKNIWQLIFYPIQSVILIIAISLISMMLINSSFQWTNYGLSFTFIALILLSMYTLQKLLFQIKNMLENK